MAWKRTRELLITRSNLVKQTKYSLFVYIFDYVNMALDLKKDQYGLKWRLHSTILRYDSMGKDRKVLNKLFEEGLEKAYHVREEAFPDPLDRQLIEYLRTYIYAKKNQASE